MDAINAALRDIKKIPGSRLIKRLNAELTYAKRLSDALNGRYDALIMDALKALNKRAMRGALIDADVYEIEDMLSPMTDAAKKYRIICVGHAHIDMNWMWRYDETVSITLDTMRTMLNLLDEFPQFRFAQSQASVYRIVEEFEPELLPRIRTAIARGQWEVTASTWVEADRNLPSVESIARQLLYTKRYLPELLGVDPAKLCIDYEPDTFGHARYTPGLLNQAGVKYAYHCRGFKDHALYRWIDPSGGEMIMYRDHFWYLGQVEPDIAYCVPDFCESHKMSSYLKVYGVGDHGGGPTRRDIKRLIDMQTWPIFPRVEFGSYADFFADADAVRGSLPVVDKELNYVFTGCYTTQTRIKMGNRISERWLNQAETVSAFASAALSRPYNHSKMEQGWRNVLFNQFHDIIPGSGVIDTREHAMGLYQQTYALAGTQMTQAARAFASRINTSRFPKPIEDEDTAQGAGVGFGVYEFGPARVERGVGNSRIIHVFNTTGVKRDGLIEVTLWDFRPDADRIAVMGAGGATAPYQLIESGHNGYWGHDFMTLYVAASVPAFGYTTFCAYESNNVTEPSPYPDYPAVHEPYKYELKNDCVCASFDPMTGRLSALTLNSDPTRVIGGGGFRLIDEEHMPDAWGSAWIVGRYRDITELNAPVEMRITQRGPLRQELQVKYAFRSSTLTVKYALEAGCAAVKCAFECDWRERGGQNIGIPQLQYHFALSQSPESYLCDIPGGVIERQPMAIDVPCQSFMAAKQGADAAVLIADTKYGFRGDEGAIMLTLIRSSYDPDPSPEYGAHKAQFALHIAPYQPIELTLAAQQVCCPPFTVSGVWQNGDLPCEAGFMAVITGDITISAVKQAEDSESMLVRLTEISGKTVRAEISCALLPKSAHFVDLNESRADGDVAIAGSTITFKTAPYATRTLSITF